MSVRPRAPRSRALPDVVAAPATGVVLVVTLVLLAVGSHRVQHEYDAVLREMRPPACPVGGLADLRPTPWSSTSPVALATVVEGWHAHSSRARSTDGVERVAPCALRSVTATAVDASSAPPGRFADAREVYRDALRWRGWIGAPILGALAVALAWSARRVVALRLTLSLAVAGTVALVVENATLSRQVERAWWSAVRNGAVDASQLDLGWLHAAALTRWISYGALAALVGAAWFRPVMTSVGRALAASRGVRLRVVVAGVFASAMLVVPQSSDAVRRWTGTQMVSTLSTVVALGAVITLGALGRGRSSGEAPPIAREWRRRVRDLAPLVAGAIVLAVTAEISGRRGLVVPAVVLGAAFVLSVPLGDTVRRRTASAAVDRSDQRVVVAIAGAAWPVSLGLLMVGVGAADAAALSEVPGKTAMLVWAGMAVLAASAAMVVAATTLSRRVDAWVAEGPRRELLLLGSLAAAAAVPTAALAGPGSVLTWGPAIGSISILALFLVDALLVVGLARVVAERAAERPTVSSWLVPPILRHLGVTRPPVVGFIVVWALGVQLVGPGDYHAVRQLSGDGSPFQAAPSVTVEQMVDRWVARQEVEPGGALPAVVVAASGGGLRAAYWTAAVLDCVIEAESVGDDPCAGRAAATTVGVRRQRLLMMSGVSGGSLGLVSYAAAVGDDWNGGASVLAPRWFDSRLGADFQSPVLARLLFGDLPEAFLRHGRGVDRAVVLERAWESQWPDGALGAPFVERQHAGEPLLVLAGFDSATGCRFNTSILSSNGSRRAGECARPAVPSGAQLLATSDLSDLLCADRDLRRSTAALLSARFPYVSPSGRLDPGACHGPAEASHVVDGGYLESSAASPVAELAPAIEVALTEHPDIVETGACVVPIFVQVDSREVADLAAPGWRPNEATLPLLAVNRARSGVEVAARAAVLGQFTGPVETGGRRGDVTAVLADGPTGQVPTRWFAVTPHAQPSGPAPLGWSLADETRADLQAQLRSAAPTIQLVRAVLDGDHLGCTTAPDERTDD